jgi:hypothetical protein
MGSARTGQLIAAIWLILTEHTFSVPLDHDAPDGATIELAPEAR